MTCGHRLGKVLMPGPRAGSCELDMWLEPGRALKSAGSRWDGGSDFAREFPEGLQHLFPQRRRIAVVAEHIMCGGALAVK